jgi:hypothetical protein
MARLEERLKHLEASVSKIYVKLDKLDSNYVTQSEFKPVKMIVYGLAGTILAGVVAALLALVLRS